MKGRLQPQHPGLTTQMPTEPILFGGFDPLTSNLRLMVEASTVEQAQRRMLAVAPLVELEMVEHFNVLCLDRPSRAAPLFMEGFFQATKLGMKKAGLVSATGISL